MTHPSSQLSTYRYQAAGLVVCAADQALVLLRPRKNEIRLPKGHIDPGETAEQAALRETTEEAGLSGLVITADLGEQVAEFELQGVWVVRTERYFLAEPGPDYTESAPEAQFERAWLPWQEAIARISYPTEREWLERAYRAVNSAG